VIDKGSHEVGERSAASAAVVGKARAPSVASRARRRTRRRR
jgi:hypothetical protein